MGPPRTWRVSGQFGRPPIVSPLLCHALGWRLRRQGHPGVAGLLPHRDGWRREIRVGEVADGNSDVSRRRAALRLGPPPQRPVLGARHRVNSTTLDQCPLCPSLRTQVGHLSRSEKCQQRTWSIAPPILAPDVAGCHPTPCRS